MVVLQLTKDDEQTYIELLEKVDYEEVSIDGGLTGYSIIPPGRSEEFNEFRNSRLVEVSDEHLKPILRSKSAYELGILLDSLKTTVRLLEEFLSET